MARIIRRRRQARQIALRPAGEALAPTQMYAVVLTWIGLLMHQAPSAQAPVFEDPSAKGSLFRFDRPDIPYEFQGVWADKPENCNAVADRGIQVNISAGAIGVDRVAQVEGYSDHPAIVVTLWKRRGETRRVALDISRDGRTIRIEERVRDRSDLLVRCPPPPDSDPVRHEAESAPPGRLTFRSDR